MQRADVVSKLSERTFLTFAGTETFLLFIQNYPLREFCAFEVVDDDAAWQRLETELLQPIAEVAATRGFGLLTDSLVWRASADYVNRLATPGGLAVNQRAVQRVRSFIDRWKATSSAARACPVLVTADVGPRGDGYAGSSATADASYEYHAPQIEALASDGIDLLVPLTMTSIAETLGILRAAERLGVPVLVSPTIETDGTLPDGTPLGAFVTAVDEATSGSPVSFMVNCAHPTHLEPTLRAAAEQNAPWLARVRGLRANASTKTHAELDNSTAIDRGDPEVLGRSVAELRRQFAFTVVGGCCGTDAEHLRCIATACQ